MTLGELFEEFSATRAAGDYRRVLELGIALVNSVPDDPSPRLAMAGALTKLGNEDAGKRIYKAMVWHCAKAGFPLAAAASAKLLERTEPEPAGEALEVIAGLYCAGSDRIGPPALPTRPSKGPDRDMEVGKVVSNALAMPDLMDVAVEVCESFDNTSEYPEMLPSIPMLSRLDEETLLQVLKMAELVEAAKGDYVIKQNDPGDCLYLVADGRLRVYKETDKGEHIPLAALNEGSVFGEMSVITGEPRSANVVVARDALLLEITRKQLIDMAEKASLVADALEAFRRERLVYNLMSVSPLFRPLSSKEKFALLQEFGTYEIKSGTVMIEEGSPGQGLYLVLHGECTVRKGGESVASLKEGDVFGEVSLITDRPATATVTTARDSVLLFLPKEAFAQVEYRHPEVGEVLNQIAEQRTRKENVPPEPEAEDEHAYLV